ncbi:MAG: DUF2062 domain-containing protein, partial [Myxococcota bacterium]|nr:DUF2062 domain-containing protein [Myxococcota bacterium]
LPIFGCHTPLIVFLCVWFQLDAAIAWVVSNVSNPFFAPALLAAELQIGAWLRTGAPLRLDRELPRAGAWHHVIGYMLLGAPLAGLILAILGGAIAYALVALLPSRGARERYSLPDGAPAWIKAVERVATRFAAPYSPVPRERTRFHYLRAKLLGDPVAKLVVNIAGERANVLGSVLDVGTGRGQLPLLLIELGLAANVCGFDWDKAKIAAAQLAAARCDDRMARVDATFTCADVRTARLDPADTVLVIDVLHYFTPEEQDAIIDRVASAVLPGGCILVREADTQRGWRSLMTLAEERIFTLLRFNRGERVCFRSASQTAARLEAGGLRCTIRPAWGRTPFSNVLIVGEKPR